MFGGITITKGDYTDVVNELLRRCKDNNFKVVKVDENIKHNCEVTVEADGNTIKLLSNKEEIVEICEGNTLIFEDDEITLGKLNENGSYTAVKMYYEK